MTIDPVEKCTVFSKHIFKMLPFSSKKNHFSNEFKEITNAHFRHSLAPILAIVWRLSSHSLSFYCSSNAVSERRHFCWSFSAGDGEKLADVGLDDDHCICIWNWRKEEQLANTRYEMCFTTTKADLKNAVKFVIFTVGLSFAYQFMLYMYCITLCINFIQTETLWDLEFAGKRKSCSL